MSKCCKCAKWWPHNWLCLKGLSVLFLVLFYMAFVFAIYQTIAILMLPGMTWKEIIGALFTYTISDLAAAVMFLTMSKILKAVAAIKHAVAPCCCGTHNEEPAAEENK